MKLSRDAWIGIGVLLLLALVTVAVGFQQSSAPVIPYLSTSPAPSGALALKLWLDHLGYSTQNESNGSFQVPANTDIVFIIQPLTRVTENDWVTLDTWVEKGGLLILAGDNGTTNASLGHYQFELDFLPAKTSQLDITTPLLQSPLLTEAPFKSDFGLVSYQGNFSTLLASASTPVVVFFEKGQGQVVISSMPYPFSNKALKEDSANGALILNFIALGEKHGSVWFDDWHHGIQKESVVGPEQWLRKTSGGHAILFAAAVVFIALLLRGRSFGRYVPLPSEIKRRGPLEHVTAIANLNRKARHRREVLAQYHQRVKRQLGRRYRLDPSLSDAEYVRLLAEHNPTIEKEKLLDLLKRLSKSKITEAELVKLAAEASEWMKE